MLTSSTSGALSGKLYGGTLDGLPDHHRTHTAFTGALTPVEPGAPSIRPPVTRRTFSFIHVKLMLMRMDPRVNQLHIQTPSRARRMICPRHKRGRRTFICEDGCLMKKI